MKHRVLRKETRKDRDGNDEIFISVEINDGKEIYIHSEWLTPDEVEEVKTKKKTLDDHILEVANRGVLHRPARVAHLEHQRKLELARVRLETAALQAGVVQRSDEDEPVIN